MVILAKSLFLPVNIIIEPVAESTLKVAVFLKTPVIDHDLPSRTAGVRTGSCDTGKFFIKSRKCNLHF